MATIPPGPERQQEQLLFELLAGGLKELQAMGATLVGGHTIEGHQVTIGYTVLGEQCGAVRAKGALCPGDALVLTKPLGTGVLLAAHMQARLKAKWLSPLIAAMLRSNEPAARVLDEFAAQAATDITGFGLAGHLLEMLRASDCADEIDLAAISLLPGAAELLREGLESTLAGANRDAEQEIAAVELREHQAEYAALFDPQTCGGLLVAIAEPRAEELCRRLIESGNKKARVIGRVVPNHDGGRLWVFDNLSAVTAAIPANPQTPAASRP
jgi:selenide,water dikinase